MLFSLASDAVLKFSPKKFSALSEFLSPELINECLADTGIVTLRKRCLLMEMRVRANTGMSLFRSLSISQLVSHLDIVLPVFEKTRQLWFEKTSLSHWNNLTLMVADGSHLLSEASFGSVSETSEVDLAARLAEQTPDHPLTILDKDFAPGKISRIMHEILAMAGSFVLPAWRQRHYPRAVKKKPQRYPLRPPSKA